MENDPSVAGVGAALSNPAEDFSDSSLENPAPDSSLDSTDTEEALAIVEDDIGENLESAYTQNILLISDGQVMRGKVVRIEPQEVLIDIGYKSEGVIPLKELAVRQDVHPSELVSVGEEIEAVVIQKEDKEGRLLLSKKRAHFEKVWNDIEAVHKENKVIKGVCIEVVKGGLIVDIGLRGFLPASLVDLRRVGDLDQFINTEIEAKILELDRSRNNVVLSRRAWLEETYKEERVELMGNLMPGAVKTGVVSSVVHFGAFVDLGGMDGLVHLSELSWKHIEHPNEVVAVGDEVQVRVLGVDSARERIALSLKATQQGPWEDFAKTHNLGELVYGRVTKLVPFGAFIQVGDNIEGLVHISELSPHRVENPAEIVTPGEELWVKIIEIDPSKRRISLSIKQALEGGEVSAEYQEAFGEYSQSQAEYAQAEKQADGEPELSSETEQTETESETEQTETEGKAAEPEQDNFESSETEQTETEPESAAPEESEEEKPEGESEGEKNAD